MSTAPEQRNDHDTNVDIFRHTSVRYLGYANEVGEAFRALVNVNWVRLSYVVASGYVVLDATSKGVEAYQKQWTSDDKFRKTSRAVGDTLVWQGLASVVVPGITINRLCATSLFILRKYSTLAPVRQKWLTVFIGLACIPFIIKPIDRSVDYVMNSTIRTWHHIEPGMNKLVYHSRSEK